MSDATAPESRRGWWWLSVAVVAMLIASDLPIARTLLPVQQPLTLLVAALASCALVGWWRGGNAGLAVATVLVAVVRVGSTVRSGVSAEVLTAGWSVMAAACFGVALLAARSKWFLGKGVVAVLAALLLSLGIVVGSSPQRTSGLNRVLSASVQERADADVENWQRARSQMARSSDARADSATTVVLDRFEQQLGRLPQIGREVLPSMLALQTLAAMALAWALFHRFSRTRLGNEIGRLAEFRFNDHWIWSVIVGLVLALLPALEGLKPLGVNMLVFFGALYALRGAAVLSWFLRPGRALLGLLAGAACLLLLRDGAVIALGLVGLGDTWADWRRRIRPAVS